MVSKIKRQGEGDGFYSESNYGTILFLSFWTDRSGQTVQTQTRLLLEELLEEQSDQGLHCKLFCLSSASSGRITLQ